MRSPLMADGRDWTVRRLAWSDGELGSIPMPRADLVIREGFGSGLAIRAGAPPGTVWAVCDRGPNLKVRTAIDLYGAEGIGHLEEVDGAKLMPRTDLGPAVAELRVAGGRVELLRTIRLADRSGRPLPGLPIPGGPHAECEPVFTLAGEPLPEDASGADTESVAALAGGGFWLGEEYGPSLLKADADGRVVLRLVPEGSPRSLRNGDYEVAAILPALAARRRLNRGFEAIALSPDERLLHLMFQSPLAHPDRFAHEQARHVRLWSLDAASGAPRAQYLYPLDPPESFRRDCAKGPFERSDIKVSEIAAVGGDVLLVLERGSQTTKIYRVALDPEAALPAEHWDEAARPTVEEMSAAGDMRLPVLAKQLLFTSDEAPEVAADLEGMALLSPTELLLVSDNDFGVEGAETSFWLVSFDRPIGGDG